jgi:hypothetical protein
MPRIALLVSLSPVEGNCTSDFPAGRGLPRKAGDSPEIVLAVVTIMPDAQY